MKNVLRKDEDGNYIKRGTKTPETILEEIEWSYPWIFKQAETLEEISPFEVRIKTTDGRYYRYSSFEKRMHEIKLFDDVTTLTEQEWRKGFASCLRRQLRRKGMTNYMLVKRLEISPTTLSNYLYARSTPPAYMIHKIAAILNCSIDDLYPNEYIQLD